MTAAFFDDRPNFRQLLRHIRGGAAITGPVLDEFATAVETRFHESMALISHVIAGGQATGDLRGGDPRALAHLHSVLVNEYVLLTSDVGSTSGSLTAAEFHVLIDGALRESRSSRRR
ncbi:MAG: TetR/AcrR family transcriptional regulator [Ilumatobacteraceae bacterium]|nr:TetR/AcrR family transcriptional regulator [Ilumatobacteraceae bacterium]